MAASTASKVKFRILSCSGEDPDYPVVELLTASPQSKGWQSSRFCDYPQEIILQFMSPIVIKQIQFLSHQCKIASRIELFSFLPELHTINHNSDLKWTKLGFLSLDPNERSNFQARELKSVFLNSPALYFKMHLHKCHSNRYNLFNQVGLIALNIFGDILTSNPYEQQYQQQQRSPIPQQKFEKTGYTVQYDKLTLEKLDELEHAKDRAVHNEDFKEAKRLKSAIDKLKLVASQLSELENRKTVAIQNEDYDTARVLKEEINRLRHSINIPDQQRPQQEERGDHENRTKNELMYMFLNKFIAQLTTIEIVEIMKMKSMSCSMKNIKWTVNLMGIKNTEMKHMYAKRYRSLLMSRLFQHCAIALNLVLILT